MEDESKEKLLAFAYEKLLKYYNINYTPFPNDPILIKKFSDDKLFKLGFELSMDELISSYYREEAIEHIKNLSVWKNHEYNNAHEYQINVEMEDKFIGYLIRPIKEIRWPIGSKWVEPMNIYQFAHDAY